jgi:Arc/MetJ family transcription regulator
MVYNTHTHTPQERAVRTNIELDDELVNEAMTLTGVKTKREVVHMALGELVRLRKKRELADLAGKVRFTPDFDHKTLRELRGGTR